MIESIFCLDVTVETKKNFPPALQCLELVLTIMVWGKEILIMQFGW